MQVPLTTSTSFFGMLISQHFSRPAPVSAEVVLQNYQQINYTTGYENMHRGGFFCELAATAYNVSVECPYSEASNLVCPG